MCPEPAAGGTTTEILVWLTALTCIFVILSRGLLFVATGSKFVPFTVTALPTVPITGLKPETVGAPGLAKTVKFVALVAVPAGAVTVIGPVVAPAGTVVTICVAVAEVIVAAVPLKVTESWLAVGLNADPLIVTVAPTTALDGVNAMIDTWDELRRPIARMLPTAS